MDSPFIIAHGWHPPPVFWLILGAIFVMVWVALINGFPVHLRHMKKRTIIKLVIFSVITAIAIWDEYFSDK